ncbi:MAG TPA: hypothetical protein IAC38_01300 [Candidatus Caccovivens faecavium]|nr:hypothetical protein [Candidatus Caccovivens faecavium]
MGLFKTKQQKEIQKKMLVKRTVNSMNKQIARLEEQKKVFIDAAKRAKEKNLDAQFNLALSGYRMTVQQQKRAQEMLLNFEITAQMRDVTMMTTEFLKGMSVISKEMSKLADAKEFEKIQAQFEEAITAVETQTEQIDSFMEISQESFASAGKAKDGKDISADDFEKFIMEASSSEQASNEDIDKEIEELKKKIDNEA